MTQTREGWRGEWEGSSWRRQTLAESEGGREITLESEVGCHLLREITLFILLSSLAYNRLTCTCLIVYLLYHKLGRVILSRWSFSKESLYTNLKIWRKYMYHFPVSVCGFHTVEIYWSNTPFHTKIRLIHSSTSNFQMSWRGNFILTRSTFQCFIPCFQKPASSVQFPGNSLIENTRCKTPPRRSNKTVEWSIHRKESKI